MFVVLCMSFIVVCVLFVVCHILFAVCCLVFVVHVFVGWCASCVVYYVLLCAAMCSR